MTDTKVGALVWERVGAGGVWVAPPEVVGAVPLPWGGGGGGGGGGWLPPVPVGLGGLVVVVDVESVLLLAGGGGGGGGGPCTVVVGAGGGVLVVAGVVECDVVVGAGVDAVADGLHSEAGRVNVPLGEKTTHCGRGQGCVG